ncbi:hypothetical protein [Halostella salina]|uniref:hypothetical protein n=1 Tax=Halostella salina TaxID=1547897 RepID=UPI000EF7FE6A|nr:hypothetical protein [Halostella salina]
MTDASALPADERTGMSLVVVVGTMLTTVGLVLSDGLGTVASYGFLLGGVVFASAGLLKTWNTSGDA